MLTEAQIANIERSDEVQNNFEITSNTTGVVVSRRVNNGDHIAEGTVLFDIADLSNVWLMFDAYESDLPFLNKGNKISFTVQAIPGTYFSGNIIFIDPVIDPITRVSKVRVEINNRAGKLKPEMFATGIVNANLAEYKNNFIISRSAVLWTGKRSVVYVKQGGTDEPIFKIREVELGPMLGNSYVIMSGLSEGDEIVTQGTFSVDAAAQLEGKPSMMNIKTPESSEQTKSSTIKTASFRVSGNCDLCKERIEKAAKSLKGVKSASWDSKTKKMHVEFDSTETSLDAIQKTIAKAGHDTDKEKTPDNIYKELPECCLYRK
jgi:Cu(I)/Ag(I) efflux system membrane fusion protein